MDGNKSVGKAAETFTATLSDELLEELKRLLRGPVFSRNDVAEFQKRTTIFNGNVVTPAKAVALPLDAADVGSVLKFCVRHRLFPSIKAGGYGTAGWSINGDIVVDLSNLNDIDMETPSFEGGFVPLRDMPILKPGGDESDKAPGNSESFTSTSSNLEIPLGGSTRAAGKRRRSPDNSIERALPRNPLIANFLSRPLEGEIPSPRIRRRLDLDGSAGPPHLSSGSIGAEDMSRQSSSETSTSISTSRSTDESASSVTSANTAIGSSSVPEDEKMQEHPPSLDGAVRSSQVYGTSASGNFGAADPTASPAVAMQKATAPEATLNVPPTSATRPHMPLPARSLAAPGPSTVRHDAPPPAPQRASSFGMRSEDPFGYLSSTPLSGHGFASASVSSRPQSNFVQPIYQQPQIQPFAGGGLGAGIGMSAGSTSGFIAGPSSTRLAFNDPSARAQGVPGSSPTSTFLSTSAVPVYPKAYVTFGAGVKQKDVDFFTASNPLPATDPNGNECNIAYHVPLSAHPVGSSVMMLGGFGFLSRLHGLSIDAVVEIEMVLADGTILIVNKEEQPDLWWAMRGAGPAFGVATRYKAVAYPVPIVFAGNLIYNFHPATAVSLIKHFRDCVKGAPQELYANVFFTAGPADKGSLIVVQICYIGPKEKGQEYLQTISSWDGEPCLLNEVSEKSFLNQQDSVAQILRGKAGRQWFIRSALVTSLPDDVIHKTVLEFADAPVGCTWFFELAGGAVGDADDTCFPKNQRESSFTIAAFHQWELGEDDPRCISTAEHWIYETLAPVSTKGPLPAFFGRHENADRIMGAYGENWGRLCEIKRKYDPHGLFRNTFWPLDAAGETMEAQAHEPPSP